MAEFVIGEGDFFFMPPHFAHEVKSLDDTMTLSHIETKAPRVRVRVRVTMTLSHIETKAPRVRVGVRVRVRVTMTLSHIETKAPGVKVRVRVGVRVRVPVETAQDQGSACLTETRESFLRTQKRTEMHREQQFLWLCFH